MKTHYRKNSFLPLAAALAMLVNHASAGTTWDGGASNGNWQNANNWDSNVLPTFDATTDLLFREAASGQTASYIQANRTVRSLTFNSFVTTDFIIGLTNGNANFVLDLTMGDATNAAAITVDSGAGNIRIGTNTNATAGSIILANNLAVAQNSTTSTLTIDRPITESGGARTLTKSGAGTLLLSGANTYTGDTTLSGGTLRLDNNAATGTQGNVLLSGASAAHLAIDSGVTIANNIIFSNTNAASSVIRTVAASTAFDVGTSGTLTSDLGGITTTASILAGTSGAATDLTMSFNTSLALGLRSDVFSLTGSGSDVFVLQLSTVGSDAPDSILGWNDGGAWVNAVIGNTGNNATGGQLGYLGTFTSFVGTHGSTLADYIGAYGYAHDGTNRTVWAVINHNSEFAIIPEPTSALAGLLLAAGLLRRRRNVGS